jgi:hypothetical protein
MPSARLTRAERQAQTRQDLIDAAARVFVEKGFANSSVEAIAAEAKSFDIKMPILKDVGQKVAEPLGVIRTAETFVIEPKTWKILYHGPLNDRLTYGKERAQAANNYVGDVLDAMLAGKPVPVIHQMADGCIIDFPARAKG